MGSYCYNRSGNQSKTTQSCLSLAYSTTLDSHCQFLRYLFDLGGSPRCATQKSGVVREVRAFSGPGFRSGPLRSAREPYLPEHQISLMPAMNRDRAIHPIWHLLLPTDESSVLREDPAHTQAIFR